ncbi:MAG TPA: hypothetical protein VKD22_07275 [Ramlibacter sp.]|nr:hypothetical protein [Ramlibacter sp.]
MISVGHVAAGLAVAGAGALSLYMHGQSGWTSEAPPAQCTFGAVPLTDRVRLRHVETAECTDGEVHYFAADDGWMWHFHTPSGRWLFDRTTEALQVEWHGAPPYEQNTCEPARFSTWFGGNH